MQQVNSTIRLARHIITRRLTVAVGLGLLAGLGVVGPVFGATLYWSGDGVNNGGNGTWDTTSSTNWGASDGGPYNQTWNNSNLDTAIFQNTYEVGWFGYTVTLGANVTAGRLQAVNSGSTTTTIDPDVGGLYKITLDATGGSTTIDDSDDPLIINAPIELTGSAQQFRGNVTVNGVISGNQALSYYTSAATALTLSGNNTFTGGFTLYYDRKVVVGHDNALGTGDFTVDAFGRTYYLAATNGDRTIDNNFAGQNWHQTYVFQGTDDLTFTGSFAAKAYTPGSSAAVNVQEAGTVVTFDDFNTVASGTTGDGFKKLGAGTMVINGFAHANTPLPFTVEGGSLLVNTAATMGAVNVASGATLGGTGTIALASGAELTVTNGASLAPGASVGTLTITNGPLNFAENAIYEWEYDAGTADLVQVYGDLVLPSVATVNVTEISGPAPNPATIFSATSLSGPGAADVSGWVITGDATPSAAVEISGTDVVLTGVSPAAGTVVSIK